MSTNDEKPDAISGSRGSGPKNTSTTPPNSQINKTDKHKATNTHTHTSKQVNYNDTNSIITPEIQEKINNINSISIEIKRNSMKIRDKLNEVVTATPTPAFIIALLISAFCILACFIIIFITLLKTPTKTDLQIPPLDSKDQSKVDNKNEIDTIKKQINNLPDIIINKMPENKTSISDQDLNKLKDAYKELNAGVSKPPDLTMITNKINSIEDLIKSTKISQEELKNSNKKLYDLSEKESNTSKELEKAKKELKDIKSKKGVNKSLLIVFAASTHLHLTEEISKEINEFFKNESESRILGFQRAFSVLRQETLAPIVRFNQDQVGSISPLIVNKDPVNLNLKDVLEIIRDENSNSNTANKEILVLAGAEGAPPDDPKNSVFKDGKQSVNIVLVARPGFPPSKITYENWIKWASNNHATITWIFDDPSTKIDHQIVSIIKKSMGKDLGF